MSAGTGAAGLAAGSEPARPEVAGSQRRGHGEVGTEDHAKVSSLNEPGRVLVDDVVELADLIGIKRSVEIVSDWVAIENSIGCNLPADYKKIVDQFPAGYFQRAVKVIKPGDFGESRTDFLGYYSHRLDDMRSWRAQNPDKIPYRIYPESGGLLPWGVGRNGALLFWRVDYEIEPEGWPILVADSAFSQWEEYSGTVSKFLADLVLKQFDYSRFGIEIDSGPPMIDSPPGQSQVIRSLGVGPSFWADQNFTDARPKSLLPELIEFIGPQSGNPIEINWRSVGLNLNSPLPGDYKGFIDRYGAGKFCDILISAPGSREHDLAELVRNRSEQARQEKQRPESRGPFHPEVSGLIPWGETEDGSTYCWAPCGADSSCWGVVWVESNFGGWLYLPGLSFSSFLLEYANPSSVTTPPTLGTRSRDAQW